jgi:uncharacterized protein
MIHPDTEIKFINQDIGYGVVATRLIPRGTITWALDKLDRIFSPSEIENIEPIYKDILDKYTFRDSNGNSVLCWDNARYVNHSFNSNCITTAYDYEIAVRDIHPGEELTDDYGYLNIEEPFVCLPENGVSRTIVKPDDLLHYHKEWDAKLIEGFRNFDKVPQALKSLLSKEIWDKSVAIAKGHQAMDSILNVYFDPKK